MLLMRLHFVNSGSSNKFASNKLLQHLAQPRDSFADVFLVRAAEADAHFVVRLGARRIIGVAKFSWNEEHIVFQ